MLTEIEDPVVYGITVEHYANGDIILNVHEVGDDPQSCLAVAAALRRWADRLESGEIVPDLVTRH